MRAHDVREEVPKTGIGGSRRITCPVTADMLSIVPSQGDLQEFFIRSKKLLERT